MTQDTFLIVGFTAVSIGIIVVVWWRQQKIETRMDALEGEVHWEKKGTEDGTFAQLTSSILDNDYEAKHRNDLRKERK